MNNSGVYEILNLRTGERYIGSSSNLKRRMKEHKLALCKKEHVNIHLQNSYNKHGKSAFKYSVLLYCDPENTLLYEQIYLDAGYGDYNIAVNASSPMAGMFGELNHFYGRKHSRETREKMSKLMIGENNHQYGTHHTEEHKRKISENNKSLSGTKSFMWGKKHSIETRRRISKSHIGLNNGKEHYRWIGFSNQVLETMKQMRAQGYSYDAIGKVFGVCRGTVSNRILNMTDAKGA